jgi:hypothetical protein
MIQQTSPRDYTEGSGREVPESGRNMESSPQKPAALLARSRLFTAAEANALHQRWLAEAKGNEDCGTFWKWLAAKRLITEHQADLLSCGLSEPAAGAAVPVGKPVPPPPVSPPRSERPKVRSGGSARPAPPGQKTGDPRDVYDVELVTVSPPASAENEQDYLQLRRRDFVMMGVGAGGVLFAAFIGWLLAHLFGRKPESSPREAANKAN